MTPGVTSGGNREGEVEPAVSPAFEWRQVPAGRVVVAVPLVPLAAHFFSTRDVSHQTRDPDYRSVAASFGVPPRHVVDVRQVHGRDVLVLQPGGESPAAPVEADAIVSLDPDRVATIRVADCIPILLADRRRRAVAAVHAGWRGTAAGVVEATVAVLEQHGVRPADLVAAIGPGIGACCYEVDRPVLDTFLRRDAAADAWFVPAQTGGRWRLDLTRANRDQLVRCGVPAGSIHEIGSCTRDRPDLWHSFRRERDAAGRMVAAIRLRPSGLVDR